MGEVEARMGAGHGFHHIWEGEKRSGGQEAERVRRKLCGNRRREKNERGTD